MTEPVSALQQNPDGSWSEAEAIPPQLGYDVEISGHGPYRWVLFLDAHKHIACGDARTHFGAGLRALMAKWRSQRRLHRNARLVRHNRRRADKEAVVATDLPPREEQ
jgi:hypothetical protein